MDENDVKLASKKAYHERQTHSQGKAKKQNGRLDETNFAPTTQTFTKKINNIHRCDTQAVFRKILSQKDQDCDAQ